MYMKTNINEKQRLESIRILREKAGLGRVLPVGVTAIVRSRMRAETISPVRYPIGSTQWDQVMRGRSTVIPLGCSPDMPARGLRIWTAGPAAGRITHLSESTNGKWGWEKVITDRHWEVMSCGLVVGGGLGLLSWIDKFVGGTPERRVLASVRGWKWNCDRNGIRLVNRRVKGMDYHPTAKELRSLSVWEIARKARENWTTVGRAARLEARKNRKAITTAESRGVRVGLADSLAAGNCVVGTRNFAARHGLDPLRFYRPSRLLAISNGDSQRVRLAVACAVKRHDRMTAAGAEVFYP